jgi:hypothetical protein
LDAVVDEQHHLLAGSQVTCDACGHYDEVATFFEEEDCWLGSWAFVADERHSWGERSDGGNAAISQHPRLQWCTTALVRPNASDDS